ncbi:MAG: nucleoside 2-deoxyribosyltransferase [Smithellaceae bacterium]|mgnify:CR=1 FL=1|nr:nucleoside 2-deoxyribosyltransferase [Syntrophaceae bacterium]MDD4240772.1 nucleoside 2-deoxyribosyltransferase [Smithellaceae bacterium]NLX51775.1 nucleoside 2-deoxyribosyltransferase [Deltaproteobacteria bacterium]
MTDKFLKIYFAGAIRAGRGDTAVYEALIDVLKAFGDVLTEHVGDPALSEAGGDGPDDRQIHDRDMAWLRACDCVVAEVTTPSLGVGYELAWATVLKKPVLCLYRSVPGRPISAMIAGSPGVAAAAYTSLAEAITIMKEFVRPFAEKGSAPFRAAVPGRTGKIA